MIEAKITEHKMRVDKLNKDYYSNYMKEQKRKKKSTFFWNVTSLLREAFHT